MFREGGCGSCVVGFSTNNILTNKIECRAVHSVDFSLHLFYVDAIIFAIIIIIHLTNLVFAAVDVLSRQ